MAKLPDFEALSIPELRELITAAQGVLGKKVDTRRAELEAELAELTGKPQPKPAGEKRGPVKAAYVGPNGETYSGRGALPSWAKKLGVTDRAGLEPYRIK